MFSKFSRSKWVSMLLIEQDSFLKYKNGVKNVYKYFCLWSLQVGYQLFADHRDMLQKYFFGYIPGKCDL